MSDNEESLPVSEVPIGKAPAPIEGGDGTAEVNSDGIAIDEVNSEGGTDKGKGEIPVLEGTAPEEPPESQGEVEEPPFEKPGVVVSEEAGKSEEEVEVAGSDEVVIVRDSEAPLDEGCRASEGIEIVVPEAAEDGNAPEPSDNPEVPPSEVLADGNAPERRGTQGGGDAVIYSVDNLLRQGYGCPFQN
jgi:hypothetical protein